MKKVELESYTSTIFEQSWFLDIVANASWSRELVKSGEEIIGSFTYCSTKKLGQNLVKMPKLTQHLGPWINESGLNYYKKISRTDKVIKDALSSMPKSIFFSMRLNPCVSMLQQFYWLGYKTSINYTYVLDDIKDHKKVLKGMESKVRTVINKNNKDEAIYINTGLDVKVFYDLMTSTYKRQGIGNKFSEGMVAELITTCKQRGCGEVVYASDRSGNVHSAAFIVWDEKSAYYLLSGSAVEYRKSNSLTLVLWESIKLSSKFVDRFDFEGSMIEPIAKYVRGFGSVAVPYYQVTKYENFLFEVLHGIYRRVVR